MRRVHIARHAEEEEPAPSEQLVGTYRSRSTWDRTLSNKRKTLFSAISRMAKTTTGQMWSATFRRGGVQEESEGDETNESSSLPSTISLRFERKKTLAEVRQEVAAQFGWDEPAMIYETDQHGWERPIVTEKQLASALEEWELSSGPRTRFKYDALFTEVEGYLASPTADEMLRGAGAAWELVCRQTHHELLGEGFIESLQSLLACGSFTPACHAAAAINMLLATPETASRFSPQLAQSLEKAVCVGFNPPSAEVCAGRVRACEPAPWVRCHCCALCARRLARAAAAQHHLPLRAAAAPLPRRCRAAAAPLRAAAPPPTSPIVRVASGVLRRRCGHSAAARPRSLPASR